MRRKGSDKTILKQLQLIRQSLEIVSTQLNLLLFREYYTEPDEEREPDMKEGSTNLKRFVKLRTLQGREYIG